MSVNPSSNSDNSEQRHRPLVISPLLALRRHWLKSLLVFVLIAGIGLPVSWKKGAYTYYAQAEIQINARFVPNLQTLPEIETHSDAQYARLVSHQIRTITRPDVIERALNSMIVGEGEENPVPLWRLWKRQEETARTAVRRLGRALWAFAVPDTYLVIIGLEDQDPAIIAPLINAVVASYIRAAKDETFFGAALRLKNLRTRSDRITATINDLGLTLEDIAERLGLTTFEEGLQYPYDLILADRENAWEEARRKRVMATAELGAALVKHERLLKLSLDAEAKKLTASDSALSDLRANLYDQRAKLAQTMSGLEPKDRKRQAAEEEISRINDEIMRVTDNKIAEMTLILEESRLVEMRAETAEYEAKLKEAREVETSLRLRVEERAKEVDGFMKIFHEGLNLHEEIQRQRRQLNKVRDRIDAITMEKSAPGYVRVVSMATTPEYPFTGGRKKLFILFVVAATGIAFILPLALEFLRMRKPVGHLVPAESRPAREVDENGRPAQGSDVV